MNLEIKPEDISIDYWGSKPVPAWNVNNQRGVKITHLKTGIVVTCESERSQHRNKALAMEKLREKLAEYVPPKSVTKDDIKKVLTNDEITKIGVEYQGLHQIARAIEARVIEALETKNYGLTNKTCNLENKLEQISHIVEGLYGSYEIHEIRKQLQEVLNHD